MTNVFYVRAYQNVLLKKYFLVRWQTTGEIGLWKVNGKQQTLFWFTTVNQPNHLLFAHALCSNLFWTIKVILAVDSLFSNNQSKIIKFGKCVVCVSAFNFWFEFE